MVEQTPMPTLYVEPDLRLILAITAIGFSEGRLQVPIQPGRVGLLVVGGRIKDRDGEYRIFGPGERPAMVPLASRLYGIPGLGRVHQEVIEFARNPGRVIVTIRRSLLGLSRGPEDPASVKVFTSFRLADPVAFLDQVPNWDTKGALLEINKRLANIVRDTAEAAIVPRMHDISASPSYLTDADLGLVQRQFRELLDHTFKDWGLNVLDDLPPVREYPNALTKVLYDVRLGAVEFNMQLERDLRRGKIPIELKKQEVQSLLSLGPVGSFLYLANNSPEVAIKMIETGRQQAATTGQILRTILLTQSPDAEISKSILLTALQQQQGVSLPFNALGASGTGVTGVPALDTSSTVGIPAFGAGSSTAASSFPFDFSAPTVIGSALPASSAGQMGDLARLKLLVSDETVRLRRAGAEVEELGVVDNRQIIEVTVDGQIAFRLRIGPDFSERGPQVDHVAVRGVKKRPSEVPGLLPTWQRGNHLDSLVTLVQSGYFG